MPIFTCPKCTTPLQIPEDAEGMILGCPQCRQNLLIPAAHAPPPPVGAFQVAPTARFSSPAGKDGPTKREEGSVLQFVPALSDEPAATSLPKPLFFGILGALGCLLAAMLFEIPLHALTPEPAKEPDRVVKVVPEIPKVDVAFVLDVTGSMGGQIEGVRGHIERFVDGLKGEKMDVMVGLVYFRDRLPDGAGNVPEDPKELLFDGKPFTNDPALFRREAAVLRADGGGDTPESGWDALDYASKLPFRADAAKVLIFITDAPPNIPDKDNRSEEEVAGKLRERKIQQLHLICGEGPESYQKIQRLLTERRDDGPRDDKDRAAGKFFNLNDFGMGRDGFTRILEGTRAEIAEEVRRRATFRALTVEGEYESGDMALLVVGVSVWTAGLALFLTLALIFSSRKYLRQRGRALGAFFKGSLSLFAGLLGGLIAQGLVLLLTWNSAEGSASTIMDLIAKVTGWTVMGGLVGFALAFFVPNLSFLKGFLGGSLGGLSGALFYVVFTALFGDLLGRWLGALALGFCVGMLVALVETVFRRWWLEVRFGTGEVRTVTLGSARVSVGSDPLRATVVVPDGPAIAYRFYLDRERVFCEDHHGAFRLNAGDTQQVGETTITVCSPETTSQLGLVLELSSGKAIPLSAGLPLTREDVPGLNTASPDGTVALVSPHADDPASLWLRNRSKQKWRVPTGQGQSHPVEPGQSIPLLPGMSIEFGAVQGRIYQPRVYTREAVLQAQGEGPRGQRRRPVADEATKDAYYAP